MSDNMRRVWIKNGMIVYVSESAIAQKGLRHVKEQLGIIKRWPVVADLSGTVVMVEGDTHEDAVSRYLSRSVWDKPLPPPPEEGV